MPILVESRLTPAAGSPPAGALAVTSAIATSARAVVDVLLEQRPDFRERFLLRLAWNVIRAGQRDLGHRGCLERQGTEVFRLKAVHVGLAAGARQHLRLECQRVQEVVDALRGFVHLQALAQLRVLRGDAHRAAPSMAVVTAASRDADSSLIV